MTTHAGHLREHGGAGAAPAGRAAGRTADRAARRAFRSRRVWFALPAALLVTAVGVLVAIETLSALVGNPARAVPLDRLTSWAADARYEDWAVLLICAAVALLGLVFLMAGLVPGRGRLVPLHGDDPDLVVGITRHGLRTVVVDAARDVDGVSGVRRAKVGRHRVAVAVGTAMRDPEDLGERVREAVQRRLDEIGPLPARRVTVTVQSPRE